MNYNQRIDRVIEYIGLHLDDELNLTKLSSVACFSEYHFHRLFTAYTGLSLWQYVRWARLKRAAHQLIVSKDKTIIEIALNAGFESHASFSRAFKQACGQNPLDFRLKTSWAPWQSSPYLLPKPGDNIMDIEIRTMPAKRLAAVEHRGPVDNLGIALHKLTNWVENQPMIKMEPGESFGFAYNDPRSVPAEEFRFDLAVTISETIELKCDVVEKTLPSGRYAIALHKGSRDKIGDTVNQLYRDWLPQSGEDPDDLPCIFCYLNFDHEVAETEALTECWLLLKS